MLTVPSFDVAASFTNHVERAELCQNELPNGLCSLFSDLLMCAV